MASIDSRVVTMKFDNKAFQQGVADTLSSLQKLAAATAGLPAGASKGLSGIGSAVANTNIGSLTTQVDGVTHSFSALTTVATAALGTIAVRATDAGLAMAKSFTLGPITDGFAEYELTMGSIQTILANTQRYGTSLKDVTRNLDELNHYADKTIYNFGDMTKNIGLFTNAGIRINAATSMIKGFSNVAAASGTNAQGAASAAYQLSQALSAGTIRLMDWRSLQNVGMGNKNMQQGITDIADAMGELDKAETSSKEVMSNFNGSLEKNWLSADVMSNYLKIMAGDMTKAEMAALGLTDAQIKMFVQQQKTAEDAATKVRTFTQLMSTIKEAIGSGWSETFKIVLGDFNSATKLFTDINNAVSGFVDKFSNSRNELLKGWAALGGRESMIEGLKNVFVALGHVLLPISQAFRDIFPPATAKGLADASSSFASFTEKLIAGKDTMEAIREVFKAVFGVLKIVLDVAGGVFRYFFSLFGLLAGGSGGVLDLVASFAHLVNIALDFVNSGQYISKFFDTVIAGRAALLAPIIAAFSRLLSTVGEFVVLFGEAGFSLLGDTFQRLTPYLEQASEAVAGLVDKFHALMEQGLDRLQPAIDNFITKIPAMGNAIQTYILDLLEKIKPLLDAVVNGFQTAFSAVSSFIGGLSFDGFEFPSFDGLTSLFEFGDKASEVTAQIGGVTDQIQLTSAVTKEAGGAFDTIIGGLKWFGMALAGVGAGIGLFAKAVWDGLVGVFQSAVSGGTGVAGAIGGFVGDIFRGIADAIGGISYGDIILALNTVLMAAIGGGFARIEWQLGGVLKSFRGMMKNIGGTFSSIGEGYADLAKAAKNESRVKLILAMAASLAVLAIAVYGLSKIDLKGLATGMAAVSILLGELSLALYLVEKNLPDDGSIKDALRMGALSAILIALAVAVLALALAVKIFASMDPDELKKGLTAVAITIAALTAAAFAFTKVGGASSLLAAAFSIGVMAISLVAFAAAIKLYAALDTGMLVEGGAKIAILIAALGLAMRAFPAAGALAAAAAIAVMAGGIFVIAGALKVLATMDAGDSWQSLLTLGAALGVIALTLNLMTGTLPGAAALVVAAGAIVVLSGAILTLGQADFTTLLKGVGALVIALVALGAVALLGIATGATPALLALGAAITLLGAGVFLAGVGITALGVGLVALAANGAAAFEVLINIIHRFLEELPSFIKEFGKSMPAAANEIKKSGPNFVEAAGAIFMSFLGEVRKAIPKIISTALVFIAKMLIALRTAVPQMITTGFIILKAFLQGLLRNIAGITATAVTIVVKFINGISNRMDTIVQAGQNLVIKFIGAVAKELASAGGDLASQAGAIGGDMVRGMLGGLQGLWHTVTDWISNAVSNIPGPIRKIMGIASPSRVMMALGSFISQGLGIGIASNDRLIDRNTENTGRVALNSMRKAMSNIHRNLDLDPNMRPTITPVLDLSELTREANRMSGVFNNPKVAPNVSFAQASGLSSDVQAMAEALAEAGLEGRSLTFEQHISSPKALDDIAIYRQTRNQLAMAKEVLGVS